MFHFINTLQFVVEGSLDRPTDTKFMRLLHLHISFFETNLRTRGLDSDVRRGEFCENLSRRNYLHGKSETCLDPRSDGGVHRALLMLKVRGSTLAPPINMASLSGCLLAPPSWLTLSPLV